MVTPGFEPPDGHVYTDADFRALGKPMVTIANGAVGIDQLDPAMLGEDGALSGGGVGGAANNLFRNPAFAEGFWQTAYGVGPVDCPPGVATILSDFWYVKAAGGTATQQRANNTPGGSLFSLAVVGGTGVGLTAIGQNISRSVAAELVDGLFTASFYVFNSTQADFIPFISAGTPANPGDFSVVDLVDDPTAVQKCPVGEWTRVSATFDSSSFLTLANGMSCLTNGLQVALLIPSGSLDATNKSIRMAQCQLEARGVASPWAIDASEPPEVVEANLFTNGRFGNETFGGASTPCKNAAWTNVAQGWTVVPVGADVTVAPGVFTQFGSEPAIQFTGATGLSYVDLAQQFLAGDGPLLAAMASTVTFSAWVKASATMAPNFGLFVCPDTNDFFGATSVVIQQLQSCPANTWTRVAGTFTIPTGTHVERGVQVLLRLPGIGSGTVSVARMRLEQGSALTLDKPVREPVRDVAIRGACQNISIVGGDAGPVVIPGNSGQDGVHVTADEIVLKDAAGYPQLARNVDVVIDPTITGAGGAETALQTWRGWLAVWVIGNGDRSSAMLSGSFSSIALPPGWTHSALAGCVWLFNHENDNTKLYVASTRQFEDTVYLPWIQSYPDWNPWDGTQALPVNQGNSVDNLRPKWLFVSRGSPILINSWGAVAPKNVDPNSNGVDLRPSSGSGSNTKGAGYLTMAQICKIARRIDGMIAIDSVTADRDLQVILSPDQKGRYGTVVINQQAGVSPLLDYFRNASQFSLMVNQGADIPFYWMNRSSAGQGTTWFDIALTSFQI